jgi:DNA-binding beta-propeller fold protein YncE
MKMPAVQVLLVAGTLAVCASTPKQATTVLLPDGAPGIGFDDLRYSSSLHRVLAPAGRSGRLDLIVPETLAVSSVRGFSSLPSYTSGHDQGPTSVEEARGFLYVTDRSAQSLVVVDPRTAAIVGRTRLAAEPDYVRFAATTNELWVTEPDASRIEIFELNHDGTPVADAVIPVPNGPESLVFDTSRRRAYTHRWQRSTVVLDVSARSVVAEWPNGCTASRGIALDEAHGWLFAACKEGTVTVLDVAHDGRILSTIARGSGNDVIGYNPKLGHLYLAGGACGCFVVLGVNRDGKLTFLERAQAPDSTHCAAADDVGHAWVCDPKGGKLWRFDDRHPSSL